MRIPDAGRARGPALGVHRVRIERADHRHRDDFTADHVIRARRRAGESACARRGTITHALRASIPTTRAAWAVDSLCTPNTVMPVRTDSQRGRCGASAFRAQHDAPERLAALDVLVRGGRFGERVHPVDDDLQPAGRDVVDVAGDHRPHPFGLDLRAEEHAGERAVAHRERRDVEWLRFAPGVADGDGAPR